MDVAQREARAECVRLMLEIDEVIASISEVARESEIEPVQMRLSDGSWALAPLYLAKSNALSAYVSLIKKE